MMKLRLTKALAGTLVAASVIALNPVGASAQWKKDSNGWWNSKGSSWSTGWEYINYNWYYFGQDGYMKTGWIKSGEDWYYLKSNGEMATNTIIDGYSIGYDGIWIQPGWKHDSRGTYYVRKDGSREAGLQENDSKTGNWRTIDSVEYIFGKDGYIKTGWVQSNNRWYYAYSNGTKAVDTVIDGYTLDLDGAWINKPTKESEEARNLILKEDSKYIAKHGKDCRLLKRDRDGMAAGFLEGNWKIPEEEVFVYDFVDLQGAGGCTYMVGKTSKNIYCLPKQDAHSAYQIKNNEVVKTFEGTSNDDWRNLDWWEYVYVTNK